jgi:hypothetical protein
LEQCFEQFGLQLANVFPSPGQQPVPIGFRHRLGIHPDYFAANARGRCYDKAQGRPDGTKSDDVKRRQLQAVELRTFPNTLPKVICPLDLALLGECSLESLPSRNAGR